MPPVVRVHKTGGPEVLVVEEVATPALGPGEARVQQRAIGINYIDVYHRSGVYPLPQLPHGIGMEGAGVVSAVGAGVTEVKVGDRVAYAAPPPGAYAAERVIAADRLVSLPDSIDDRTAASVMLKGMTVEYLIRRTFPVQSGMTVLFHAAAGGVGLLACQWLKHLGATVIGTVGGDAKAALAREHGCDHPIVYTREDFAARVREITGGQGVPVVFDSIGRETFEGSLSCLQRRGTLVSFGNASGVPVPFDPMRLSSMGSLYLTRPVLFDYVAAREELLASAAALFDVLGSGAVRSEVRHEWPLAEVRAAHTALEARQTMGAAVLVP